MADVATMYNCIETVANSNDISSQTENALKPVCPTVIERYFTCGYQVNLPKSMNLSDIETSSTNFNDVRILRHSNRICIITLANSHPIIDRKDTAKVSNVSFKVTEKLNRSDNQVSGKRKRGAHWLNPSSPLCIVTCDDGTTYTVYSGIRGSLVEMNDRLLMEPTLLQREHETEGFIAIVMPKISESDSMMKNLLSEVEYQEYVKNHPPINCTNNQMQS